VVIKIDLDLLAADDRALAHASRNYGRVACHSTSRGKNGARSDDPVEILGRRLIADKDNGIPARITPDGGVRVEDRATARRSRTRWQPNADRLGLH
jgi:hypothetical protein